jgi:transposase InsO family protein
MDERKSFVREALRAQETMSALCERYGVSRKTGYKWLARYEQEGLRGLQERSRAPKVQAGASDAALERKIVQLRRAHRTWGPKKLRALLMREDPQRDWPALSTIGEILKRSGCVVSSAPRREQKPVAYDARPIIANAPNDLWTIDLKGAFELKDRTWCAPLTLADAYSRYVLESRHLPPGQGRARYWIERAFRTYGLPLAIRSDNGTPFAAAGLAGLSYMSVWWLKLGIVLERTRPGHPEHNPRHERFHRTLKQDLPICAHASGQQRALNRLRHSFNHERPHEALAQRTPASLYRPSAQPYPTHALQWHYGTDLRIAPVNVKGYLSWRTQTIYLSEALRGEQVGLRQIDDEQWRVFLGTMAIATLFEQPLRIVPYIEQRYHVRDAI